MTEISPIVSFKLWLFSTIILFVSMQIYLFLADANIRNRLFHYLRFLFMFLIGVFLTLPSWAIWFVGMMAYFLSISVIGTFVLIIPVLILWNSIPFTKIPILGKFIGKLK
jgi:hypothetical protein